MGRFDEDEKRFEELFKKIIVFIDIDSLDQSVMIPESDLEKIKNHPNRHLVANALFRMSMDLGIEMK